MMNESDVATGFADREICNGGISISLSDYHGDKVAMSGRSQTKVIEKKELSLMTTQVLLLLYWGAER